MLGSSFVGLSTARAWRAACFSPFIAQEAAVSHFVHLYQSSLSGLRRALPVVVGLISIRQGEACIASSIDGLGPCRSTFCKAERRAPVRAPLGAGKGLAPIVRLAQRVSAADVPNAAALHGGS
jgi:hypothetical protein